VPQPDVEIVSIIDLDGPLFENITDEPYYDFQKFLANLKNSGIFWVTKPCQTHVQDACYAQVIGTPGRLNTLHWVHQPEPAPLKDHDLEIEMHAVGVNFKGILVGMNFIDHVGRSHGLEGAGVVRRIGPNFKDFKAGDRVAAMEYNMLSTLLIANEIMCVKIPDSLSFINATTMFTVYATVQQSLITVGQLKKGESLLIHCACGGVGLAAIQIARMIGAEIYNTFGSEEKVQYLVKNCDIPSNKKSLTLVMTLSLKRCTARPTARVWTRSSTPSPVSFSVRPRSVLRPMASSSKSVSVSLPATIDSTWSHSWPTAALTVYPRGY